MKSMFKSILTVATASLAFLGCVSTGTQKLMRFQEPGRTMNYIGCIQAQLPVTVCQCVEDQMFNLFPNEKEVIKRGYQDQEVLVPIIQNCMKEVMPELERNQGFMM